MDIQIKKTLQYLFEISFCVILFVLHFPDDKSLFVCEKVV